MRQPDLPETRDDIIANVERYFDALSNITKFPQAVQSALVQSMTKAMGWVVAYRDGRWIAGPTKFVGSGKGMTPEIYERYRKRLNANLASETIGRIFWGHNDRFTWSGSEIPGNSHPAVRAIRGAAQALGKDLRAGTRYYILRGEGINDGERGLVERLLADIEQANLSPAAREALLARIGA